MKKYFRLLSILMLIFVNNAEVDNTDITVPADVENPCDNYCYSIVKILLDHDNSVLLKEKQFGAMQSKIHEQELIIKGFKALNETIKSKDIQLAQQLELNNLYKTQINTKDVIINEKEVEISNLKALIKENDQKPANPETLKESEKQQLSELRAEIRDQEAFIVSLNESIKNKEIQKAELAAEYKNNIASKDVLIATLQSQVKSQETLLMEKDNQANSVHKAMCLTSSCVGKLTDLYTIKVPGMDPFPVPCDSKLADSGWTVIQRRKDGSVDFNRTWTEYKAGFGDLRGEFFLGLEKLHLLTNSQPHELYIYLEDFANATRFAKYTDFLIGNEAESYALKTIGTCSGNANDALKLHLNMKFSTPDRDNDLVNDSCAKHFQSGWWYGTCGHCDLNGRYTSQDVGLSGRRISWNKWHSKPLKFTQMMIRPKRT